MTESVLKAILRLYALVAQLNPKLSVVATRNVVESYLSQLVSPEQVRSYLIIYDFYFRSYKEGREKLNEKLVSVLSVKALIICEQINLVIEQQQKALVLLNIFDLVDLSSDYNLKIVDFIKTISEALNFKSLTFENSKYFILDNIEAIDDKSKILVATDSGNSIDEHIPTIKKDFLSGRLVFLYLPSIKTIVFRYLGSNEQLYLNGRDIIPYRTYALQKGASIRSPKLSPLYYSDISSRFVLEDKSDNIQFSVEKVRFKFPNSENGIYQFSFSEKSGRLVGIMGGSGVGKSTLLNLLNGNLKPVSGNIYVNGYNIHLEKNKVKGLIGYIPQDDLLIEELTVYQNLYYNARLCFDAHEEKELRQMVDKMLVDLDLYESRHLKVGNPLNKFISGGQRKRLNIALELIREPSVLFVDEPTSGLSSNDSDRVMDLLKEQTRYGKLVIVNIHQPSSDIFKMFDKLLMMDKGGRIVYQGNPIDAISYFKSQNNLINASESECLSCGNVNPEQVLQIIEASKIDEKGKKTGQRIHSPAAWYETYIKHIDSNIRISTQKQQLPTSRFRIPSRFRQFTIFSIRNMLSKLTDKQYLLINLLEAPLLAAILGLFTRYNAGTSEHPSAYVFSENENLPVFLFMSVVVSLFIGLMVSAEEIIKDRKILKRETFLNLSRASYIHSKILLLFILSAIQTYSFVLIGSAILNIHGMMWQHWLILFSTSFFSNLLGLNISASFKSVVAIYIFIPLLLVPQILLGGAMLKFDKLNKSLTSEMYVPLVGDIMTSRWAYEAMAVNQFMFNSYQQIFYDVEKRESSASFKVNYLIPEMENLLVKSRKSLQKSTTDEHTERNLNVLYHSLSDLIQRDNLDASEFSALGKIHVNAFDMQVAEEIQYYLFTLKRYYSRMLNDLLSEKDELVSAWEKDHPGELLLDYKQKYHNNRLESIVLNKDEKDKLVIYKNRMIQKAEPIFLEPYLKNGRAHFYAPVKSIGNFNFYTYWFNFVIINLMSVFLYILLITDSANRFKLLWNRLNFKRFIISKLSLFKTSRRILKERFGFSE